MDFWSLTIGYIIGAVVCAVFVMRKSGRDNDDSENG